jgi:hypothetical protein
MLLKNMLKKKNSTYSSTEKDSKPQRGSRSSSSSQLCEEPYRHPLGLTKEQQQQFVNNIEIESKSKYILTQLEIALRKNADVLSNFVEFMDEKSRQNEAYNPYFLASKVLKDISKYRRTKEVGRLGFACIFCQKFLNDDAREFCAFVEEDARKAFIDKVREMVNRVEESITEKGGDADQSLPSNSLDAIWQQTIAFLRVTFSKYLQSKTYRKMTDAVVLSSQARLTFTW